MTTNLWQRKARVLFARYGRNQPRRRKDSQSYCPQLEVLENRTVPSTFTWRGSSFDNFWSDGSNWQGGVAPSANAFDDLVFPDGTFEKTSVCDFTDPQFGSITISGSGYSLNNNSVGFSDWEVGTIATTNSSGTNTINSAIRMDDVSSRPNSGRIISTYAGTSLDFTQTVRPVSIFGYSVNGAGSTFINLVDGTGFFSLPSAIVKNGTGTLTIAQSENLQSLVLNQGTLRVTSNNSQDFQLVLNGGIIEAWNGPATLACPVAIDGDVTFGGNQPLTFTGVATLSGDRTFDVENTTTFGTNTTFDISLVDKGLGFGFTKTGSGALVLAGLNVYNGETVLDEGTLVLASGSDLGLGTVVLNGGTIEGGGSSETIVNPVILGGDFTIGGAGSLDFTGPISLTGDRAITVASTAVGIFDGSISEDVPGRMLIKEGSGELELNVGNSYSGGTVLYSGTLEVADNGALGSGPINFFGGTLFTADSLTFSNPVVLDGNVTLSGFSLFGSPQYTFSGLVTLTGDSTLKVVIPTIISGPMTEDQAGRSLIKAGNATLEITTGAFPGFGYTGTTTVQAGTLQVDGYLGDSDVIVQRRGLLDGTGIVGAVTIQGGAVKPGDSPGVLTATGDVIFQTGSSFTPVLDGAGGDSDQLNVQGSVTLTGAYLKPVLGSGVTAGTQFTIIESTGPITGIFTGLANGAVFNAGGGRYRINYGSIDTADGVLNTVDLTVLAVPTTISVTSSANPSAFGQLVTFTATVSAPAGAGYAVGSVTFAEETATGEKVLGTAPLVKGKAVFQTSTLAVGSHPIQVHYGGSASPPYLPAVEGPASRLVQIVHKATTATGLISSFNPSTFGQAVTFTAAVSVVSPGQGIPTGTVTFKDGATVLATVNLQVSGGLAVASFTTSSLSVGTHHITAVYNGDVSFQTSVSAILTQTVMPPST
jgi:autotransporter-associated beta strand protein